MSHEQFPSSTQMLEAASPTAADLQAIENYANNGEAEQEAYYEQVPNGEANRRLGGAALNLAADESIEAPTDEAGEEEIRRREAYRDPTFPNGMEITIGIETYMVTGVSFTGDNGNYKTDKVSLQHMAKDGETITMEPEALKIWIATAEAHAAASQELANYTEDAEIADHIDMPDSEVNPATGENQTSPNTAEVEALVEQLRDQIDQYSSLGFSTNDEINIGGETYTVKTIELVDKNSGADSEVTIQHKDSSETYTMKPEELQSLLA